MKYVDEYRDEQKIKKLLQNLEQVQTRSWRLMEVCGGQTHSLLKFGLDELLAGKVDLVHGPGCPVCVTPIEIIDHAIELALQSNVILSTYADMLRVPGRDKDLLAAKSEGADVRYVYSPLEAVELAQKNPDKEVVFLAIGFETTAPAHAMAVFKANQLHLNNFSVLVSHVLVPPAMKSILSQPENRIDGFLAAGHVCTVTGYEMYHNISKTYQVPVVVAGFEPVDLLQAITMCVYQLEQGRFEVENQYTRSVKSEGNREAQKILDEIFICADQNWRGLGRIPDSGLKLKSKYERFNAVKKFSLDETQADPSKTHCGYVLQGRQKPTDCPHYLKNCTPEYPLGAPMVSQEGACHAYSRYGKTKKGNEEVGVCL